MAGEVLIDQVFVKKLTDLLEENYTNEQFGVKELAKRIRMNRSQIYRKLNSIYGISISQYIREYRLQKAMKLLQDDVVTASEISFKVGFNSPTYFNTSFREYYGYPPGEVKFKEPVSNTHSKGSDTFDSKTSHIISNKARQINERVSKEIKIVIPALIIILVTAFAFYFYTGSPNMGSLLVTETSKKSIAVLPFRDMSPEDTQWFCDGITDNILTHLSQVKELTVISFTSSNTYKGTDKKTPQIAQELGVSYIVEGSVTMLDNKVKINAQLINANDEHIWSKEYIDSFDDVFTIQKNVALDIVKELKINISPEEEKLIAYNPTDNFEAYKLFQKGKNHLSFFSIKEFELGIDFIEQAIVLDPNFAEAYEELAYAFSFSGIKRDLYKARQYIDKALEINPQLARAYSTLGMISSLEMEKNKAGEYFKKAVELNPNDARAQQQLGVYYTFSKNDTDFANRRDTDFDKSYYHVNLASILDPFSKDILNHKILILRTHNKLDEAEALFYKNSYLFLEPERTYQANKLIKARIEFEASNKKDWTEVINGFKYALKKDPTNSLFIRELGKAYDGILNDDKNHVKYCEMAYKQDTMNWKNVHSYYFALVSSGNNFKEAKKLLENTNTKLFTNEVQKLQHLFDYYYYKKNYKKAQEILMDSLMPKNRLDRACNYAQLNDRKNLDKIFQKNVLFNYHKAIVYAILMERDSMYYYLEKKKSFGALKAINRRYEFDPYRKEERFKAFLKKNYLPITHQNE